MAKNKKKINKRKKKESLLSFIWRSHKDRIIAIILAFIWIITLLLDNSSLVWEVLNGVLVFVFWELYKFIFTPALIILSILLLKEDNEIEFNWVRVIWLLLYFTWLVTLLSNFIEQGGITWVLNITWILDPLVWKMATIFIAFSIFATGLFAWFKFSIIHFGLNFRHILPSSDMLINELKPSKISQTKDVKIKDNKPLKGKSEAEKEYEKELEMIRKEKEKLEKENEKLKQLTTEDIPKKVKINNKNESKNDEKWGVFSSILHKKTEKTSVKVEKKPEQKSFFKEPKYTDWKLPWLELLENRVSKMTISQNEIELKKLEIQEKLAQFRIKVDMLDARVWPTVVQYRLQPAEWVKLNRIENLKKDLTLALKAKSIRIQAPIPWEGVVWIEVPNEKREMVGLKETIQSEEFNKRKTKLPLALWKDVSGNIMVWDLTKMPHLLVAGQTASWKSVWMNGFLVSLLYRFSPNDLKFIMVDPKRVELSIYNGIPHLLTPVITNPEKATNALKWCVAEMLRRYDLSTEVKARNLEEYNAKVSKDKKLPYIVIVIDELADLMMSGDKKEVETSIARIAQMARAVGMHLIVATQRPSVDVITGLIKANIPSRIAFTVASQIDSRTVIDKSWAEDLLGMWDMLYYPTWATWPERVQWVFVDTDEVESVVNQLKLTIDPNTVDNLYDHSIANGSSKFEGSVLEWVEWVDEDPELVEKAIEVVKQAKKGSTSLVQRKLGLWYARAAKMLDILEELGIVWPPNGSKPRDVYVD